MDLPSMVQRSGDTLIVRSVVSGNQLYMDQTGPVSGNAVNAGAAANGKTTVNNAMHMPSQLLSASVLEQQLERYQQQLLHQQQQHQQQQQQQQQQHQQQPQHQQSQEQNPNQNQNQNQMQQHQTNTTAAATNMDAKEEGLPQCKIKRNYSCSHCTYFTQNPRYHLTHLRDVHGEKIVINKCKLCLYASRHFQKLVRHMKMVHGCTDGIPGGHGQARGKRGMSREARKRRLEESVGVMGGINRIVPDMPTLEQVKRELQLQEQKLQRDIEAFKRQQEEQKQMANSANLFAIAYERQLHAQRELEVRNSYERDRSSPQVATNGGMTTQPHTTTNNITTSFQPTIELATPSPSGSATPPSSSAVTPSPASGLTTVFDEQPQNRLLKCSLCDFTTLYRAQLVDHELEDHCKTKFFRCEKCSYVTHIKARFSKHVKYHSMPMIKCVTCDFRTPYKWNLDRHMKNHGGTGPFKCAACDFTADIKQSLTVHEMNHHVPPVGNAAGISLARRRNKVGGTDISDDFLSDSADLEDQFNNNMDEEYDDALIGESFAKRTKYEDDEPTDLSQKGGGSSDTSSNVGTTTPKSRRPVPNLIPLAKSPKDVLDLSKDLNTTRSSLTEIASMFFSEQQISEILDKSDAPQLSPSTTIASASSHNSRSLLTKKSSAGNFFDKLKSSALTSAAQHENLICQCGYVAKCLSESIIHGKTCNSSPIIDDDMDDLEIHDDGEDRLEIDEDDDDKQSHSALNLSVTGSTRCQHCRHRCKSSVDLLNHLKQCAEAIRCANEMYDSTNSGESNIMHERAGMGTYGNGNGNGDQQTAVQQQRVCIWNAKTKEIAAAVHNVDKTSPKSIGGAAGSSSPGGGSIGTANGSNEENSYYGVETAPGYGEVTKKMTPEEEAANSSLKKVYKCPHCSFWASTASRFHVHIVGHLNKKPFECSLCSYRSNWRWDITKHIRLKTIRDPSHKTAKVLMNDETGRRNYTKYNKYITLMKVTEEDGDPKLMKSGEMTPNQVASLAFLKDYNKLSNGLRDDITLEPVSPSKSGLDENHLADNLIRLPLLATVMNAAMAQQQHQQHQQKADADQTNTALITPSVTISPVKRSPPPLVKPSDDLITEVHQEGSEKKTIYRCRKCTFRHQNRDAVLAHVKVHYQDPNYPIVTATLNSSPKSSSTTPLQVSVNSNQQLYMNKVFAAMCLSQQQGSPNAASSNSTHSIIPAGLLQQAIQQAQNSPTPNATALSGLALALAGKCPSGAVTVSGVSASPTTPKAASILEHGEQKASQYEASADSLTSPTAAKTSHVVTSMSLQDLLTSPRSIAYGAGTSSKSKLKNCNNNLVMGLTATAVTGNETSGIVVNDDDVAAVDTTTSGNSTCDVHKTTVITNNTTPPTTSDNINHLVGSTTSSFETATSHHQQQETVAGGSRRQFIDNGDSFFASNGVTFGYFSNTNNNTSTSSNKPAAAKAPANPSSSNNSSSTCSSSSASSLSSLSSSSLSSASPKSSSSPTNAYHHNQHVASSGRATAATDGGAASHHHHQHNHSPNSSNLLTAVHDGDRREPSPYRCGHCHQVSNWKHVIQRHCRLKHSGDIRIETLERNTTNSNAATVNGTPVYRPLGGGNSGATIESSNNYGLTQKALQQQQNTILNTTNNNNNTSLLQNKNDHLLHSPLPASAVAAVNAASTTQDLQNAAVYWAAAYKAAAASASGMSAEELLQLQNNDQIEITRLPSNSNNSHSEAAHLAQLLEQANAATQPTQNSTLNNNNNNNTKSKQQKCPICPYISESKSQMNYHISLHKPTQYECHLCTFVCAKKQHLSSHLRTVHQQQLNADGNAAATSNGFWSLAVRMAAIKESEEALKAAIIDLAESKQKYQSPQRVTKSAENSNELPPEYQYKLISYCSKCPARFAQKHNDEHDIKTELEAHLRAHETNSEEAYICEYCEYHAEEEQLLQLHRAVHMAHYQEKYNELYRNCKEDPRHPAPKLMQIACTRAEMPESIWVVDNELSVQLKQQTITSTTPLSGAANFEGSNSLLKKQLESGGGAQPQAAAVPTPIALAEAPTNPPQPSTCGVEEVHDDEGDEDDDEQSNSTPSTSASVATSDLAADGSSDAGSCDIPHTAQAERCLYCPFETLDSERYKQHMQKHICVSKLKEAYTCAHCDYTDAEESHIEEHTAVHFNPGEKLKSVEFFTSYDNLEISVEQDMEIGDDELDLVDGEVTDESVRIKQEQIPEHNNNLDNVVNENTRHETEQNLNDDKIILATPPPNIDTNNVNSKNPPTKIILYKNDGGLSIKQETRAPCSDNISDRLRRRILRGNSSGANSPSISSSDQESAERKMIIVNAKTGKVLSRK